VAGMDLVAALELVRADPRLARVAQEDLVQEREGALARDQVPELLAEHLVLEAALGPGVVAEPLASVLEPERVQALEDREAVSAEWQARSPENGKLPSPLRRCCMGPEVVRSALSAH
jgi:hypothetical protein